MPRFSTNPASVVSAGPFDVSARDLANVRSNFNAGQLLAAFTAATHDGVREATRHFKKKLKEKISRGNRGGGNPSDPGEPPKVVTGKLRSSIDHVIRRGVTEDQGIVGTNNEYAPALEFGTSKMAPRPFFRPTIEEEGEEVANIIAGSIERNV